ncbi:hypothetical protein GOODEAATRI_025182, partial [Goodea atripinnis]
MASAGTICHCLACHTGYIMSYDLHVICEGCLGPDYANLALTPQSTCLYCRRLPPEEKQWRLAIFSPLEGEFPIADQCALEEALDIFNAGRELDDSTPETATDSISTPFLQTEDAEAGATPVQAQGLPMSATTPLPAMGALVSVLPDIIAKGFPPVPALELSLSAVFGVRSAQLVGQRPVPLSSSDQITARLTAQSHQCAAQVADRRTTPPFPPFLRRLGRWSCHRKMWRNSATLRIPSLTSVRHRLCAPPASLPGRPCYSDRCGFGSPPPFPRILRGSYWRDQSVRMGYA